MSRGNGGTFKSDDIAVERELPCQLTDDELRMRGDAMAEAELLVDQLKDERRALNKKIFAQTDARNKLAHVIDSEQEPRLVVCKWVADFDQNVYRLVRQDTGDVVEQRAMSAADRQGALPYPEDTDAEASVTDAEADAVDAGTDDDAADADDADAGDVDAPPDAAPTKPKRTRSPRVRKPRPSRSRKSKR